ncbi:MAG: T9SS type A sorting domain-containing protein [Bacteroidia bacterium]
MKPSMNSNPTQHSAAPSSNRFFGMKNIGHRTLALIMMALPWPLLSQSPIFSVMGNTITEEANCMTILNSTASVFGGRRFTPNFGNKTGYVIWERPSSPGVADFARTYSVNSGDFEIRAMDAALPVGSIAVVANRTGAGVARDGYFMHISSTGTVLHSKTFNSSNNEFLTDVKCMSNGSFVVTGTIENASTQRSASFATRIGPASANYPVLWSRVLGSTTGSTQTFDRAVAADERPDGSILIGGFTNQGASTPEGEIYLWHLDAVGATQSQFRYRMPPDVHTPFPSDMRSLGNGDVQIVGSALDSNGVFKGFQMQIGSDFLTASFNQLNLVDDPSRAIELRSIDAIGSSPTIWAAGLIDMPSSNTHENEALLVQFSPLTGLMRSHALGFTGEDALRGIKIESTNGVRAGGLTVKTASPFLNLTGVNVLNTRTNAVGNNCNARDVSLMATPFDVTISSMFLPVTNSLTISSVSITVGTPVATGTNSCSGAKMAYDAPEAGEPAIEEMIYEVSAPTVFPNPARSNATLRLLEANSSASVQLYDISGKLVRELMASSTETQIDLGGLRPGLYLLQVQDKDNLHSLKLMVE